MSGIYQKHVNQSTVTNPPNESTFVGVNEAGKLFTKNESGTTYVVSNTQSVPKSYLFDVMSVFSSIVGSFSSDDWTSSHIIELPGEFENYGQYETQGNFTDEPSSNNIIGISNNEDNGTKEVVFANYSVRFSGGTILGSFEESSSARVGGFNNIEYTYKYEFDSNASGSNPQHIHDFRIIADSTIILGYVVINADGSDFNNFIIDSPA